jgi:hypothetical protein
MLDSLASICEKDLYVRLKLISDFVDYYDYQFDREGPEFRRMTTEGPSRREMFDLFDMYAIPTPKHGIVKQAMGRATNTPELVRIGRSFLECTTVIVYLDERAHMGTGKVITSGSRALQVYPEHYCSEYIEPSGLATSLRYLCIGKRAWWLRYTNLGQEWPNTWLSNVGEQVRVEMLGEATPDFMALSYILELPLFAVDFVQKFDQLLAIDLNIAPGLKGTGMEDVLKPKEVYDLIEETVHLQGGIQ